MILPFKGLCLYSDEPPGGLGANLYPVPDLRKPFLGVHFTFTASGKIKIGPTAIPAFWREQYRGLANFSLRDLFEILPREMALWWRNELDSRRLAADELAKSIKRHMVALASRLATGVDVRDFRHWDAPGIRAQLYDLKARRLEMGFRFEGDFSDGYASLNGGRNTSMFSMRCHRPSLVLCRSLSTCSTVSTGCCPDVGRRAHLSMRTHFNRQFDRIRPGTRFLEGQNIVQMSRVVAAQEIHDYSA